MIKALYTAATGMRAQQTRIDVVANNLANVNTSGFKKSTVNFQDLLYSTIESAGASNADGSVRPAGLQIGSGTRLVSTSKIFTPGVLEQTGRDLDWMISGDGFFKLTDLTGGDVFTRDGNFHIDAQGNVTNSDGLRLNPGITVPQGARITISQDGTVTARIGNENGTTIGQLTLSNFPNPAGLESVGANIYRATTASGVETPGNPGTNGLGQITQGFIERSNVEVVDELVDLIVSQRAYEINSRAINTADEMLTTANNILQ